MTQKSCLLVILCGIPGAGKSTFASNLITELGLRLRTVDARDKVITCIGFDDIIPRDGLELDFGGEARREVKNYGIWREYRFHISTAIDNLIAAIVEDAEIKFLGQSKEPCEAMSISKHVEKLIYEKFMLNLRTFSIKNPASRQNDAEFMFILDDNFYYKSMRYQYFKICRKYNISFCQIHIDCPVETALIRNRSRDNNVPDSTIIGMATKLEAPDQSKESWEKMSLQVDCSKDLTDETWIMICDFVDKAITEPVSSILLHNQQQKEQSRLMCLTNIIHQGDKILRRLIGEKMKFNKEIGMSKCEMKVQSEKLNNIRHEIMKSLKDEKLTEQIRGDTSTLDDLQTFLRKQFNDLTN